VTRLDSEKPAADCAARDAVAPLRRAKPRREANLRRRPGAQPCRRRRPSLASTGKGSGQHERLGRSPVCGYSATTAFRPRRARRAAHHARSLLHRCRRRLPDEHRRRGVDDRARDLCGHRDDRPRPVSLTARNASRESAWRHVRDRSMACSRGRARPGKGILGRVRTVPHRAPSPRHITERVLRDTPRARTTKSLLSPSSVPVGVRRISSRHCNSSSESCSVGVAKSKRLRG
jgi:hypothetical protein